jgi:hypothetical protein
MKLRPFHPFLGWRDPPQGAKREQKGAEIPRTRRGMGKFVSQRRVSESLRWDKFSGFPTAKWPHASSVEPICWISTGRVGRGRSTCVGLGALRTTYWCNSTGPMTGNLDRPWVRRACRAPFQGSWFRPTPGPGLRSASRQPRTSRRTTPEQPVVVKASRPGPGLRAGGILTSARRCVLAPATG